MVITGCENILVVIPLIPYYVSEHSGTKKTKTFNSRNLFLSLQKKKKKLPKYYLVLKDIFGAESLTGMQKTLDILAKLV